MDIQSINQNFDSQIKKFIIPDPNDKLINIYEIDKLSNLTNIRAEKYDSQEFKTELQKLTIEADKTKEFKVPRNLINPNYTEMVDLIGKIHKAKSVEDVNIQILALLEFVNKYRANLVEKSKDETEQIDITLRKGVAIPDVRCVPVNPYGIYYYFDYLYNKYAKSKLENK